LFRHGAAVPDTNSGGIRRQSFGRGSLGLEEHPMTRKLLVIAALSAAVFSLSAANAAPATNMLETLKASAGDGSIVQEARYRHHRGYRHVRRHHNCWWGDRWLCRYFW
jgi:hypothetical protein